MKKILLSISVIATMTVSAQGLNAAKDGFRLNYTDPATTCSADNVPNNGGIMAHGPSIEEGPNYSQATGLVLVSTDSATTMDDALRNPTWFPFPEVTGTGITAVCSSLNGAEKSMDLSAIGNGKVAVVISSDIANATFDFLIGGQGKWGPTSSTYNTGAGLFIEAKGTVTVANTPQTFEFDFETLDPAVWSAWTGKSTVESYGFRSQTSDAVFTVAAIRVGAEFEQVGVNEAVVTALNLYPNPATEQLNVVFDATSVSTVELTDLTGKVVATQSANAGANAISFNVANVNAGVYFVNIKNVGGNSAQKVIIK